MAATRGLDLSTRAVLKAQEPKCAPFAAKNARKSQKGRRMSHKNQLEEPEPPASCRMFLRSMLHSILLYTRSARSSLARRRSPTFPCLFLTDASANCSAAHWYGYRRTGNTLEKRRLCSSTALSKRRKNILHPPPAVAHATDGMIFCSRKMRLRRLDRKDVLTNSRLRRTRNNVGRRGHYNSTALRRHWNKVLRQPPAAAHTTDGTVSRLLPVAKESAPSPSVQSNPSERAGCTRKELAFPSFKQKHQRKKQSPCSTSIAHRSHPQTTSHS